MNYSLLNTATGKKLTHPKVGLWYTPHLKEAEEMLEACKEYLRAEGLEKLQDDFVIVEIDKV